MSGKNQTVLHLRNQQRNKLPAPFSSDDVRYTEELVEYFLHKFTSAGDTVLDPFMGFGTSLLAAERLGRVCYGIEYDAARCDYVRSLVTHPDRAIHADSRRLEELDLPLMALSITSPPYMGKHHRENPFTAYTSEGTGYEHYLDDMRAIYTQIKPIMKPGSKIVIEASNLKHEDGMLTTLAWDIAYALSSVMRFEGEIVVVWEGSYGYGYDHSYCLVFTV